MCLLSLLSCVLCHLSSSYLVMCLLSLTLVTCFLLVAWSELRKQRWGHIKSLHSVWCSVSIRRQLASDAIHTTRGRKSSVHRSPVHYEKVHKVSVSRKTSAVWVTFGVCACDVLVLWKFYIDKHVFELAILCHVFHCPFFFNVVRCAVISLMALSAVAALFSVYFIEPMLSTAVIGRHFICGLMWYDTFQNSYVLQMTNVSLFI